MPLLVLDPGHGGRDPGALGKRLAEKDVNLKVSLRLRDALKRCGFRVLMTRETDIERVPGVTTAVDLKARAMLANTNAADLYVSWHYDACNDPKVHGVAAWIHLSQRDKPAYAKAELLAQKISDRSGQWNRGVYYGDFQVLRDTMMDAVLIEGGFITNAEEEANMSQDAFL
ncbi:MAG: N-acetylmuramoyl-L-alanine amidase family protein, partial [Tumebacillaceae bacterium]